MKTASPILLDGYFCQALTDHCVRNSPSLDEGFAIFNATITFLKGLDADDAQYLIDNRTFWQITRQARGMDYTD